MKILKKEIKRLNSPDKNWIYGIREYNNKCRYYGNTKNGYYTDKKVGDACGICGG